MDNTALCKLVEGFLYAGVECYGLGFVCSGAQTTYCVAHSLGIIAIVESSLLLLTDSLQ